MRRGASTLAQRELQDIRPLDDYGLGAVFDRIDVELAKIPVLEAQLREMRAVAANVAQAMEAAGLPGVKIFREQLTRHGFTEAD